MPFNSALIQKIWIYLVQSKTHRKILIAVCKLESRQQNVNLV